MNTKQNLNIGNVVDGFSGKSLLDINETITANLEKRELHIYTSAIGKVLRKKKLNRDDVRVLDKIDEITFKKHGMCLKDAIVTLARIKACKKFGMKFIDRDFLLEHLDMVYGVSINSNHSMVKAVH